MPSALTKQQITARAYDASVSLATVRLVPMSTVCHLPSTWRDARGKLLTNTKIHEYALDGRYGPTAQRKAREVEEARNRISFCPSCKAKGYGVRFRMYDYLPHPGRYCKACVEQYRRERNRDKALRQATREAKQHFIVENYV